MQKLIEYLKGVVLNEDTEFKVFVTVGGKRRIGTIIDINPNTTWVRIYTGAKENFVVKRHNRKHMVRACRFLSQP